MTQFCDAQCILSPSFKKNENPTTQHQHLAIIAIVQNVLISISSKSIAIPSFLHFTMVKCKTKGCRKEARWPTPFCIRHKDPSHPSTTISRPPVVAADPPVPVAKKKPPYFRRFIFDNEIVFSLSEFFHQSGTVGILSPKLLRGTP